MDFTDIVCNHRDLRTEIERTVYIDCGKFLGTGRQFFQEPDLQIYKLSQPIFLQKRCTVAVDVYARSANSRIDR